MANKERYDKVFMKNLEVSPEQLGDALVYNSVPNWDSVGHMTLMAALEEEFDIMMEPDDIIDFSSYFKGMEILAKYDVSILVAS